MMIMMCYDVNRCRRYSYVNMSAMSPSRASDGVTADRDRTQLYRDTEILDGLARTQLAHLNRRQVTTITHRRLES